ncbi:hypothetical protein [Chryseobacterium contaminans]|uniref:hypothetical protein n=1 Tax=Chryseobacterium contaminans TaxID=1423959 RepID=UPI003019D03F
MVKRFLKYIFLLILFVSCKTNPNSKGKIDSIPQLSSSEVYWGNCMRYNESFSDEVRVIKAVRNRKPFNFEGPIYIKPNCNEKLLLRSNQTPINGTYKIININESWSEDSPYSIIAVFKNGMKEGIWKYYRNEDFYSTSSIGVIKSLSGDKDYKQTIKPIKIETYKNGLPHGEWWQKSGSRIDYFTYKNGELINSRTEFVKN